MLTRVLAPSQRAIPNRIGNLVNLEALLLGNNKIKQLPRNMMTMANLRVLQLENNRLSELPASLGFAPLLQVRRTASSAVCADLIAVNVLVSGTVPRRQPVDRAASKLGRDDLPAASLVELQQAA